MFDHFIANTSYMGYFATLAAYFLRGWEKSITFAKLIA